MVVPFEKVARLPAPDDNVAIACRRLGAGTTITAGARSWPLRHTVLEGHRFVHTAIAAGGPLLSWGLPFGRARCALAPGDYVCNPRMLAVLAERHVNFDLPRQPSFDNHAEPWHFDAGAVIVGEQVAPNPDPPTFMGFTRPGGRGAGTRNCIVIMGTSSLAGSYARALAGRFNDAPRAHRGLDGVVAVAHTEGGHVHPHNVDLVLRTLAGFLVHPNVAAVLAVDIGDEPINNAMLARHMAARQAAPHRFLSIGARGLDRALAEGAALVTGWLAAAGDARRTAQPMRHLKLAMQCGGSDAFSGVSANPLAGCVARDLIRAGGSANLAETTELMGAEPYVLANVRSADVARAFLDRIERYRRRAAWHGHDAEGNLSGGNLFRGLYNIAVKSIGAARKKDPQVRLDAVIDYAQPMGEPGFHFMDSPGNDLESIAGQVASGANLIVFTTGNGSITNFPFVPTIKIVSTTDRYELIRDDMDVNAGHYQDGTPMATLARETFDLAVRVASGQRSAGERAGHAQVQLWRDWPRDRPAASPTIADDAPDGRPLAITAALPLADRRFFDARRTPAGLVVDEVAAVAPTSLCAGQIAQMIADRLDSAWCRRHAVARCVAFVHTEGCGVSSGDNEALCLRMLLGHMSHRMVRCGLFLEHGCEKTHNDAIRARLAADGHDPARFGWASVQLDGGIEPAVQRAVTWFEATLAAAPPPAEEAAPLALLRLGLTALGPVPHAAAAALGRLASALAGHGGVVVIPQNAALLASEAFLTSLGPREPIRPTLACGAAAGRAGLHVMATPTTHVSETLTALGSTGVDLMLAHVSAHPLPGHPMIPLLQIASDADVARPTETIDLDAVLDGRGPAPDPLDTLLDLLAETASRRYVPRLFGRRYCDFQITRGLLGISL